MNQRIREKLHEYVKYKHEYLQEINEVNAGRIAIAFCLLFVLEFFSIMGRIASIDVMPNGALILFLSIKLILTGGLPVVYLIYKSESSEKKEAGLKEQFGWISYGSLILLGIIQAYLLYDEILWGHTIYNYLIYLFFLTAVIIYPPTYVFPLFALISITSYVILLGFGNAADISNSVLAFIVFTIICPVISYSAFENHFEGFVNKRKLAHFAMIDPLTLIYNRRGFYRETDVLSQSCKVGDEVAAIMVDIDDFKAYNDHYGHEAGDKCLQMISGCFRSVLNAKNVAYARFGGEEFVAAFYMNSKEETIEITEEVCKRVEALNIPHDFKKRGNVITVSAGIAWATMSESFHIDELIKFADVYMYKAKELGGNQVFYPEEEVDEKVDL